MAQVNRNTLKSWFIRGAKPLAAQFADWIDSFWHKEDTLPIGSVENLTDELNKRATAESVRNVETRVATLENATHVSAHADLTGKNEEADVQHLTAAEKEAIKTKTLIITKTSLNGTVFPNLFPFSKKIKILSATCASNCDNFSVRISDANYDKTNIANVEVAAGAELKILDINILAGNDAGSVIITFKEI